MNADERTLLTRFLDELSAARAGTKDADADALIARALSSNPDAAYLLVQHAIVADQSLHAAQQRIDDLERQQSVPPPPQTSSGFLPEGSASGPWGNRRQDAYAPPPPEERPGIFSGGGGLGSFLRSAGTTAAGVAGGEMLFSGLSDLFGHRGGGMFGGGHPAASYVMRVQGTSMTERASSTATTWSSTGRSPPGRDTSWSRSSTATAR